MTETAIALPDTARNKPPSYAMWPAGDMSELAHLCVRTAERLAELNQRAIHTTISEQRAVALEAAGECSPFGAWRLHTSYALAGTAKAAAYWRHVNEIVLDAFGPNEGQAVVDQIENAMGGFFTSEVVEFRPDLSYFPAN